MTSGRNLLVCAVLALAAATTLSCQVNDYCLNCAVNGDGGVDAVTDATDALDGEITDAGDGGPCIPSGPEVCDNKDNDCNGQIDDGIADIGTACDNQTGECAGGTHQCVNGVPRCSHAPTPELCDNKDNDCNGLTDEGDPGGGGICGTNAGECVAGFNRCVNGSVQCVGAIGTVGGMPELCNGLDDDCDAVTDEGLTNLGTCGPTTNTGECQIGHLECLGGGPVCKDAIGPQFELCDALDQDCDGNPTNGYNLMTDPRNCGMCGLVCNLPHAVEGCAVGGCTVAGCDAGYVNANGTVADGCEYQCTPQGPEVCNGRDDDCNGLVDDGLTAPPVAALCLTAGECATGTTVTCGGTAGFVCNYADPDVSQTGGVINPETLCDGKDNDCDGATDEGQPNKGQVCDNGGVGDCRSTGTFVCGVGAGANGPAVCTLTTMGPGNTPEICDGKDNNCDGVIDDGAAMGNLPGQAWVTIPGLAPAVQIQQYEASRPDATATNSGSRTAAVCSKPGVLPWANVTQPQAEAACTAIGARLCSESEWQRMCEPPVPLPAPAPANNTEILYLEAEDASAIPTVNGHTFTVANTQDYSGIAALQALPDNNTATTTATALASGARIEFRVTLAAAQGYVVWVRMMGVSNTGDLVHVGLVNGTAAAAPNLGSITTATDNVWIWQKAPTTFTSTTAGTYTASVFMGEDGVRVDAIAVMRSGNAMTPPADARTWAYQTNRKVAQPLVCNGDDLDTNPGVPGDQDDILKTGSLASCFADGAGAADAFDMSGNVKEWTRERAPGQNPLRGGSANNEVSGLTCNLNFTLADDQFFFPNVGFRCCR